ncbi:aspartic proteinase 36 isoform X2 [Lactuca sativa]|uniref:aspartic proteinase 36 isoform X2 n=1 Tax=Lactuca sativa TaxID=4236 RepID=UPI001C687BF6|nr:aspartic proteinase 36 isoform X2 [Lactuca sativa]
MVIFHFRWHYNVNLESISVIVETLTIDHSVFALSDHQPGIIIDSGTTLVYITEEAYTPVVDAIKHAASNFIQPLMSSENFCYSFNSSYFYTGIFPIVRFNFTGGASMDFKPRTILYANSPWLSDKIKHQSYYWRRV